MGKFKVGDKVKIVEGSGVDGYPRWTSALVVAE